MDFQIRLADHVIAVSSLYDGIYKMCSDYLAEGGAAEVRISVSPEDIEWERFLSAGQAEREGRQDTAWSDAYLETLAVYRKIADAMPACNTFLMHGTVVAIGDSAFLFTAPSGTGKSTHARLWLDNIPDSYILNGDKPLLTVSDAGITVYGTPWAGKEGWQRNGKARLQAVFFLERSSKNLVTPVTPRDAFPGLLQQTHHPEDVTAMAQTVSLLGSMCDKVAFFRLRCNMDPEAAMTSYAAAAGLSGAQHD